MCMSVSMSIGISIYTRTRSVTYRIRTSTRVNVAKGVRKDVAALRRRHILMRPVNGGEAAPNGHGINAAGHHATKVISDESLLNT